MSKVNMSAMACRRWEPRSNIGVSTEAMGSSCNPENTWRACSSCLCRLFNVRAVSQLRRSATMTSLRASMVLSGIASPRTAACSTSSRAPAWITTSCTVQPAAALGACHSFSLSPEPTVMMSSAAQRIPVIPARLMCVSSGHAGAQLSGRLGTKQLKELSKQPVEFVADIGDFRLVVAVEQQAGLVDGEFGITIGVGVKDGAQRGVQHHRRFVAKHAFGDGVVAHQVLGGLPQ